MYCKTFMLSLICLFPLLLTNCKRAEEKLPAASGGETTHRHADGLTHPNHNGAHPDGELHKHDHDDADHDHDEVSLGSIMIGDLKVELAQAHGKVEAGKESHLVVKLPYDDKGETIVRAWLGTENRLLSVVAKGEYAPSHDDYDIHAVAPDPLPENVMWWIEIQKPDGTKLVGSAQPILD
jgi:hypothetical protein